jgi:hypothetical protein
MRLIPYESHIGQQRNESWDRLKVPSEWAELMSYVLRPNVSGSRRHLLGDVDLGTLFPLLLVA